MALINPDTGSEIDIEPDGDFTITFPMTLPTQTANDTEEDTRG